MPHDQPVIAVEAGDGHHFELIHVPAEAPRATLLFLTGMGLSARQYIRFAKALAEQGIEVLIHEWRGIGSSSLRAGRQVDWGYSELLELDLYAAVEKARQISDTDKVLFGGHSLGSQFACMLAAIVPQHCRGLLLIAGGSPWWKLFGPRMKLVMLLVIVGFPVISRLLGYYPGKRLGFGGREARGVIADWTGSAQTGQYRPAAVATDLEAGMAALEVPVLAINMVDDWFVPEPSLRWLTGKLERSEVTHQTFTAEAHQGKADHYQWMKSPEAVAETIVAWVGMKEGGTNQKAGPPQGRSRT